MITRIENVLKKPQVKSNQLACITNQCWGSERCMSGFQQVKANSFSLALRRKGAVLYKKAMVHARSGCAGTTAEWCPQNFVALLCSKISIFQILLIQTLLNSQCLLSIVHIQHSYKYIMYSIWTAQFFNDFQPFGLLNCWQSILDNICES